MAQPITPCLWFDGKAREAVDHYLSIFPNSRVVTVDEFDETGPNGDDSVVVIDFELDGRPFQAFDGGPEFQFSEAISFTIHCEDQAEVDHYWNALTDGGEESQCGWLKDRYGVSWQVVPRRLIELLRDPDRVRAGQAMHRMLQMQKIDVAELETAFNA